MRIELKCGILELGQLLRDEDSCEETAARIRTQDGSEIFLPLSKEDAMAIGKEGLLFANLKMTITLEEAS